MKKLNRRVGLVAALSLAVALFVAPAKAQELSLTPKADTFYELRSYTPNPGKLEDLSKRFRDHTLRIFARHGMKSVAYWVEDNGADSRIVYVLAYKDRAAREASWTAFRADPEWQKVAAASEANGKLVAKGESVFMKMADYSPALTSK